MDSETARSAAPLSAAVRALLRCPACGGELADGDLELICGEGHRYPVAQGVPVLLDDARSVFRKAELAAGAATFFRPRPRGRLRSFLGRYVMPDICNHSRTPAILAKFVAAARQTAPRPRILIIGGSRRGRGTAELYAVEDFEIVSSDVSWGPETQLIADGHDLPFADGSFDAVLLQYVLEHVPDPARVVAEAHRVLQPAGVAMAHTPFIQQVHGGAYDFTRWTALGHRRLFRDFEQLDAGVALGPGTALAWSWLHFLYAFGETPRARTILWTIGACTGSWFKYFDPRLARKRGSLDAACSYYFLGRRSEVPLSDTELIGQYPGMML